MSLRSPLGRVLGSGSAKDGTDHWWMQRVSAVALAVLGLWRTFSRIRTRAELKHILLGGFQLMRMWFIRPSSRKI